MERSLIACLDNRNVTHLQGSPTAATAALSPKAQQQGNPITQQHYY